MAAAIQDALACCFSLRVHDADEIEVQADIDDGCYQHVSFSPMFLKGESPGSRSRSDCDDPIIEGVLDRGFFLS